MLVGANQFDRDMIVGFGGEVLRILKSIQDHAALRAFMSDIARYLGFRYFALITHEDLRVPRAGQVDIRCYPEAIAERIIGQAEYRRDPVMRGCIFADSAFLWSQLDELIEIDRRDRATFEFGLRQGLTEGITVPCSKLGYSLGSATFAGTMASERAESLLGTVQMIGLFAYKRARALAGVSITKAPRPRLNPRPRDCVALIGRGLSNKRIARALNLAPRTVDGYLRDAFRLFDASTRAELLAGAVLAGEIGLNELK